MRALIAHVDFSDACSNAQRRARLKEAVAKLALALLREDCQPSRVELQALAELCEAQYLRPEAARVWRWIDAMAP